MIFRLGGCLIAEFSGGCGFPKPSTSMRVGHSVGGAELWRTTLNFREDVVSRSVQHVSPHRAGVEPQRSASYVGQRFSGALPACHLAAPLDLWLERVLVRAGRRKWRAGQSILDCWSIELRGCRWKMDRTRSARTLRRHSRHGARTSSRRCGETDTTIGPCVILSVGAICRAAGWSYGGIIWPHMENSCALVQIPCMGGSNKLGSGCWRTPVCCLAPRC